MIHFASVCIMRNVKLLDQVGHCRDLNDQFLLQITDSRLFHRLTFALLRVVSMYYPRWFL